MGPITIASAACSVTFNEPMLAYAWVRMLIHDIPVDAFMALFKALNPGDVDAVSNAQHLVDACVGTGI